MAVRQHIRFAKSHDGVRLAYASSGTGPAVTIKAATWLSHLEQDWDSPVWRHFLQGLSATHRLIRYDQRGTGLSDRDVGALRVPASSWSVLRGFRRLLDSNWTQVLKDSFQMFVDI